MGQFGMHMPGGQAARAASMNVYTGLLFLACVALVAACAFVWVQGSKIGKNGQPFALQDADRIELRSTGPAAR